MEVMSDLAILLQFVREVADSLLDSWEPIVKRRRHMEFTSQQKEWQMLRRGRWDAPISPLICYPSPARIDERIPA